MPNLSFDVFYNADILNFTATRSQGAPKPKPDWKVRTAPKLAAKPKPTPESAFGLPKQIESADEAPKPPKSVNGAVKQGPKPAPKEAPKETPKPKKAKKDIPKLATQPPSRAQSRVAPSVVGA